MKIYPLALAGGLLPLLTIHICYLWAAYTGHVSACVPYIHSCTSISSAGRVAPEFYLFKGLMIPAAVIIFFFWCYASQWLQSLGYGKRRVRKAIILLGLIACLGLILYSVMLGAIGDEYRMQRRIGVIVFFSLSFVAQTLFTRALLSIDRHRERLRVEVLCLKLFLSGIVLFAISAVIISSINSEVYDNVEDAFEWWVTLILCLFPLVVAGMWKKTDFKVAANVTLQ